MAGYNQSLMDERYFSFSNYYQS